MDVDHDPGDGDLEGPQDRVHCTPCYKAIRRGEYRSHGSQPSGIFGLLPMMIIRQSGRARNGECRGDGDSAIDQDREHDQRHQESRDCIARVARKPGERPGPLHGPELLQRRNPSTSGSNGTDAGTSERCSSGRCAQESAARARHVHELRLCSPAAPFQLLCT